MGSLIKTYSEEKIKGKIYTPRFIVEKILDDINFKNKGVLGKKILDPACGDGRFLCVIVERILKYTKKNDIEKNLSYVYGWDIDEDAIKNCIINLNEILKKNGINIKIKWNIERTNSLEKLTNDLFSKKFNDQFDFIVGNPPYIRIQHLDENSRKYIQKNYTFCRRGSTDIYIAFFELC